MTIQEISARLCLLQAYTDRTGVITAQVQGRLTKNLTPEDMCEVARLVVKQLGPCPSLSGKTIPVAIERAK